MSNKKLSLLTLLIIPGILLNGVFYDSYFIILSLSMSIIGGLAFGMLLGRYRRSNN